MGIFEKNEIPQCLLFRCGMMQLNHSLKKLGKFFKLQHSLLKTEMNYDDVDGNSYKNKKREWLDYKKQYVLCSASSSDRYTKAMEEITGFSLKDSLLAPGLGWKYFNSRRDENDEPICTYNDKNMRFFLGQSIKSGRVCAFIHYYKTKSCGNVLKIISEGLKFD